MSPKRQPEDGGKIGADGNGTDDKRRRVPTFESVVVDMMKMRSVHHLLEPILEPLIRKVVKEEVELALKKHINSMKRSCGKETHPSICRNLHLQFINNISLPVFTGARIEADDCSSLKVALIDIPTGQIINTGPESLAKIEIIVLEGDFDGDESDNWNTEEFRNNIVREREGKKPLITGEAVLNLKDGIGLLGEISFSDNSSWTRSRRFRLGARALDCFDGIRIREAKTEPFIVRDHRGELYKKHHPPSLVDEVWRLEKIGKDGAFHKRLIRENINTVKDFLTVLFLDPARLRNILGTGMSAKMWEVTVEHARTCVLDKRVYLYCPAHSQLKSGVVFNVVGQVMGVLSECQYVPIDKLSEPEKIEAHNLVISAYQHWEEVVGFDEESSLTGASSCAASTLCNASSPKTEGSNSSRFLASDRLNAFDYTQPSTSSPDIISSIYSTGDVVSGLEEYSLPSIENMSLRYDHSLTLPGPMGQVASSLICSTGPIGHDFFDEDHLQFFDSDYTLQSHIPNFESQTDLQCAVDSFLLRRTATASGNAKLRWTKLFSVLKWFSIRKLVTRRTRAQVRANPERWHATHVIPSRIMTEVSTPAGLVRY